MKHKAGSPFDSFIAKPYSKLFMDEDYSRLAHLSRRTPPGFFTALNIMLGEEAIAEIMEHCRLIVERLRRKRANDFDWDFVYADLKLWSLLLDTALSLASHFADFSRHSG